MRRDRALEAVDLSELRRLRARHRAAVLEPAERRTRRSVLVRATAAVETRRA